MKTVNAFMFDGPKRAPGGELLDVWNEGADVLIWGLPFGVGEIIWSLIIPICNCVIVQAKFLVSSLFSKLDS